MQNICLSLEFIEKWKSPTLETIMLKLSSKDALLPTMLFTVLTFSWAVWETWSVVYVFRYLINCLTLQRFINDFFLPFFSRSSRLINLWFLSILRANSGVSLQALATFLNNSLRSSLAVMEIKKKNARKQRGAMCTVSLKSLYTALALVSWADQFQS